MTKFVDALEQARSEIRSQRWVILGLAILAFYAMFNWRVSTTHFTAHFPPDLRNGAAVELSETPSVPDTTVYTFALYFWQQVNRWQTDGAKDYGQQIFSLQNYITPACREQLVADMEQRNKAGELGRRTRALMDVPGLGFQPERVKVLSGDAWTVLADLELMETQGGMPVKDTYIRYPLRVVRYGIDREKNRWQLALDCFGGDRPARLDAKAVEAARASHTVVTVRSGDSVAALPAATPNALEAARGAAASSAVPASGAIEPSVLPQAR